MTSERLTYRMKQEAVAIRLMCLVCGLPFLLASCVKDDLYDTPHPDWGIVAVAVAPPEGAGAEDFTVEIDGTAVEARVGDYAVSGPLPPGGYTILAYNAPESFTIADGIARVLRVDGSSAPDGLVEPLPGVLYSGTETIRVVADDTVRVSLDVAQRTRDLHIELTVTEGDPERITAVTGTLSGVAEAYDLRGETLTGETASTRPAFTRNGDRITADLRLLGMTGDGQILNLQLAFSDGDTLSVDGDLTEVLAGFNDSTEPFVLTGSLAISGEAGFSGNIDGWQQADGGNTDAH